MEEIKACRVCNEEKSLEEYHRRVRKSGVIYYCLNCKKCETARKKTLEYKEKAKRRSKEYYIENREQILEKVKIYTQENRRKVSDYQARYRSERKQTDIEFKLTDLLRKRISSAFEKSKSTRSMDLLGCTIGYFRKWLEWQFDSNMTTNNHGSYWHIDHVVPCASFELEKSEEQFICFNWKNCRPLEKNKNSQKSDKIIPFQIMLQELKVKYYQQHVQIAGNP